MTTPTEGNVLDVVLHASVDGDEASVRTLFDWLRDAPVAILLRWMDLDGEEIDLQEFETTVDRWIAVKFTRTEFPG